MKYKVTFRQRFNAIGDPSDTPERVFAAPDDVVIDEQFVERIEPPSLHNEDAMEEDDNFLAFGTSTWIYEVADGRDEEFLNALKETELVIHVDKLAETPEYML